MPEKKQTYIILFCIFMIYPLLGMGVDLIAPSLPFISKDLSVSEGFSKNLVSIYFLGFGLGNFFYGLLSDFLGRRKGILFGLLAFTLISLLPVLIPAKNVLFASRLIQGLAAGVFAVSLRSSVSNLFPAEKMAQVAAFITAVWGLGPIMGPVIGGYLQTDFNTWRAGFYFFALYSFLCIIPVYFGLPETVNQPTKPSFVTIKNNFTEIISHRLFIGVILMMGLLYSIPVVFNTLAPFVVEETFHQLPSYFGRLALCTGASFVSGTFACQYLLKLTSPEKIIKYGLAPLLATTLFFFIINTQLQGDHIVMLMTPSLIIFFSFGILYSVSFGKAMTLFRHIAGSSGAIMTLVLSLIASFVGLCMSFITDRTTLAINLTYLILITLCWLVYWSLVREA